MPTRAPSATRSEEDKRFFRAGGCLLRGLIWTAFIGLVLFFLAFSFMMIQYYSIAATLPSVEDIQTRTSQFETTRILDRNGALLYEILDPSAGRRTYVSLDEVSPFIVAATVATEDENFYSHPGFNFWAIIRAFIQNVQSGEVVSGASSITQQVARMLFLDPEEANQRTYLRKVKEAILAIELTNNYSKDEILWKAYAGLARVGARRPVRGPLERLGLLLASSRQRVLAYYHRQKFRSYCLEIGRSYREESNLLDGYWELYKAAQGYQAVALKYLGLAREIEIPISPRAEPYYLLEEGRLRRDRALLEAAAEAFDPFWEREAIQEALVALAPLLPRGGVERREVLNRLFLLNPGALLQHGLRLPLAVTIAGTDRGDRPADRGDRPADRGDRPADRGGRPADRGGRPADRRGLRRVVRRLGPSVRLSAESQAQGVRFSLSLEWESRGLVRIVLSDRATGETLLQETLVAGRPLRRRAAADLAGRIIDRLYSPR